MNLLNEKKVLREKMWRLLEEKGIACFPLPCFDRIPNFVGSDAAAQKLSELSEWKNAAVIVANPDFAQQKVRALALKQGKTLIMASPRLRKGYIKIDAKKVEGREEFAATIKGAFAFGESIEIEKVQKIDLIVTGCVAVDAKGNRLGKGKGYGDREIKKIKEISPNAIVVTTVHDMQVVALVPHSQLDQKVDLIITPSKIIGCS